MLPTLLRLRNRLGSLLEFLTRTSFALVLFLSPFNYREVWLERRVANIYSSYTDFFYYPADRFIGAALLLGILTLLVKGNSFRRGPWYLTFPLVMLVVLSWIGVLTGIDSRLTAYHSLRLSLMLGLYFLLINVVMPPLWVALPLAASLIVQSVVALQQFSLQHSVGLVGWQELVLNPQDTGTSIVRDGALRVLRAYGLTDHPNLLGGFLAFALILILGYYFAAAHNRARYFLLVPLGLSSVVLVLTFSRASALAAAVGIALLIFAIVQGLRETESPRLSQRLAVLAALIVMGIAVAVPVVTHLNLIAQRTGQEDSFSENSGEARSFDEREALIQSATRIFYKHAVTGVGNGALPLAMFQLDPEFDTRYFYQPVHLVLLEVAAELGIFGGISWLWLMIVPWIVLYMRRRELFRSPWLAAVCGALLALFVISFFDYYPWLLPQGRIWQWTAWGLLAQLLTRAS